jgi:prepilin-type processing-associated H-X9-DG protein
MKYYEVVLIFFFISLLAIIFLPALARVRKPLRGPVCQQALKSLGQAMHMYAEEDRMGLYPRIQASWRIEDALTFDAGPDFFALYPQYIESPRFFQCGSCARPHRVIAHGQEKLSSAWPADALRAHARSVDRSYIYLGWVIDQMTPTDGSTALDELTFLPDEVRASPLMPPGDSLISAQAAAGLKSIAHSLTRAYSRGGKTDFLMTLDYPIEVPEGLGNAGSSKILRLSNTTVGQLEQLRGNSPISGESPKDEGLSATIPIVWDRFEPGYEREKSYDFNHVPGGSNVLYLDGHVDFVRYNEANPTAPLTPAVGVLNQLLTSLDQFPEEIEPLIIDLEAASAKCRKRFFQVLFWMWILAWGCVIAYPFLRGYVRKRRRKYSP